MNTSAITNYNKSDNSSADGPKKTVAPEIDFETIMNALQSSNFDDATAISLLKTLQNTNTGKFSDILQSVEQNISQNSNLSMLQALTNNSSNGSVSNLLENMQSYFSMSNELFLENILSQTNNSDSKTQGLDLLKSLNNISSAPADSSNLLQILQDPNSDITNNGNVESILNSLMRTPDLSKIIQNKIDSTTNESNSTSI